MEKVFAYMRVSSPGQARDDRDGFKRQIEAIRNYTKANKMEIVKIYHEDISGTEEYRPVLADLMVSLEKNGHGVKTVIIEKLDRLARDLMVQEAIIRDLRKKGFNLVSSTEGPDLCGDDPTRKFFRQIMGAVAEYEKTMLVLKLRAARQRVRIAKGKCEGQKGYYETVEGQETLLRINELRRKPRNGKRLTWAQVAEQLNKEGRPTMEGGQWSLHRVYQTANVKPK